ncbi:MAG: DUF599 domain-containing protein [Litoreibacter sp.]
MDHLALLTALDAIVVTLLLVSWFALGWRIEHPGANHPSVTLIMADYRRAWMQQMVSRMPRIFDAAILADLRQGTSFFASGCMIAIGGVLAVIGNSDALRGVAAELTTEDVPTLVWQVKLMLVTLFLTHGFLKFVWANRLFGYCAVVMASVPNDVTDPNVFFRARQAAEINIRAAWNFNRGLRAIYFSLGALAWLIGPWPLLLAVIAVNWLIWQREFSSHARKIVLEGWPDGVVKDGSWKE